MKESTIRTAQWIEIKSRIQKLMDDGLMKEVADVICVDAMSFTEAESQIVNYYAQSENDLECIMQMTRARYKEILFHEPATKFYRCVVKFLTEDEKTGKVKKQSVHYLVQASSLGEARELLTDEFSTTMIEYEIFSITESPVQDVILHITDK